MHSLCVWYALSLITQDASLGEAGGEEEARAFSLRFFATSCEFIIISNWRVKKKKKKNCVWDCKHAYVETQEVIDQGLAILFYKKADNK